MFHPLECPVRPDRVQRLAAAFAALPADRLFTIPEFAAHGDVPESLLRALFDRGRLVLRYRAAGRLVASPQEARRALARAATRPTEPAPPHPTP